MEHKMHKAERQLSQQDTLAILKRGDHGTLSVNGDDGYPYATPRELHPGGRQALHPLRPLRLQDGVLGAQPQVLLLRHHLLADHPQ